MTDFLVSPPASLLTQVLVRVREQERLQKKRKIQSAFFGFAAVVSFVCLIPAIVAFSHALSQSGFTVYISLIATDSALVLQHWKDFGYSLLEALPVTAAVGVLGLILIFLQSLRSTLARISVFSHPTIA